MFRLPPLPYAYEALEPWVSAQTLRLHHDVLQKRYVDRLNEMVGSRSPTLESLIVNAQPGPILENASQVWNHTFLWHSMSPSTVRPSPGSPFSVALSDWDQRRPFSALSKAILEEGTSLFGSGYVWVVANASGELEVWASHNADNPLRSLRDRVPLLTIDVWEHAYLFDYRADRRRYLQNFLEKLANWRFAEANYEAAMR